MADCRYDSGPLLSWTTSASLADAMKLDQQHFAGGRDQPLAGWRRIKEQAYIVAGARKGWLATIAQCSTRSVQFPSALTWKLANHLELHFLARTAALFGPLAASYVVLMAATTALSHVALEPSSPRLASD
jgi:hypothetical protein